MKVCLPNDSKSVGIGGGWTFRNTLAKYAPFEIVETIEEADVCLVCGVTMITGETFGKMKALGKKIVVRLDGIPEPWRNPRIGIAGRLKGWCDEADGIVYQSKFTRTLIGKALDLQKGVIILNGADHEVFNDWGETVALPEGKKILSVLWRQDPNKRWDEVLMRFREYWQKDKQSSLIMVGDFPNKDFDFGFIFGERFVYFGGAKPEDMAKLMRSCDEFWFPSFADPCPNTLIEALSCGMKVKYVPEYGGAAEIMKAYKEKGFEYLDAKRMGNDYFNYFKKVLNGN